MGELESFFLKLINLKNVFSMRPQEMPEAFSFHALDIGNADIDYTRYVKENGPLKSGSESVLRGDYLIRVINYNNAIQAFGENDTPETRAAVVASASYLLTQHQRVIRIDL